MKNLKKLSLILPLVLISANVMAQLPSIGQANEPQIAEPQLVDKLDNSTSNSINSSQIKDPVPLFKYRNGPIIHQPSEPIIKLPNGVTIIQPNALPDNSMNNSLYMEKMRKAPGKMQDTGENKVPQTK